MNISKSIILKPSKKRYVTGASGIICSCFLFYVAILGTIKDIYDFLIFFGLTIPFLIISIYMIFYVSRHRILVDNEKITMIGVYGSVRELLWKDVKKVSYSVINEQLTLKDDYLKINVDLKMVGVKEFLDIMKREVSSSIYSNAYNKLIKLKNLPKK